MRFVPYSELGDTPNVVVDGARNAHTVLALSHWPKSGSPSHLRADTSVEMVFRWLERRDPVVKAEVVSNDHFDEDGLIGVFATIDPTFALRHRELLEDAARAGDFGTYRHRDAARIAFVVSAFADRETSPLDRAVFSGSYPSVAAGLYQQLLPRLPEMVSSIDRFASFYEREEALLTESERALASGEIRIEERPAVDLAIVHIPEKSRGERVHRFTQARNAVCHPMAIHNATERFRLLLVQGRTYEVQFRYETWVQYATRRPLQRVDLAPFAETMSAEESAGARWKFDGVDRITPRLHLEGADESRIAPERFVEALEDFLTNAKPAWDPYDA